MNVLLGLIAVLLAAILVTLLGWWGAVGMAVGVIALVAGALVVLGFPIGVLASIEDRSCDKEHCRLVQSLPPLEDGNPMLPLMRNVAVWAWMDCGRPGELATFVSNKVRAMQGKATSS